MRKFMSILCPFPHAGIFTNEAFLKNIIVLIRTGLSDKLTDVVMCAMPGNCFALDSGKIPRNEDMHHQLYRNEESRM